MLFRPDESPLLSDPDYYCLYPICALVAQR